MNDDVIEKISRIIVSPIREADVVHLFTLTRKLLERVLDSDSQKFSLLKLYCDWMLHTGINRSEAGALLLADAHNIIADHLQKKDNSALVTDITGALSLSMVRSQLNNLFKSFGGASEINAMKWQEIVPIMAEIISHCPLEIDPKKRKFWPILEAIRLRPLKGTSVVEELMIIKEPSKTFNPNAPKNEHTYCISLKTTDTTVIISPLVWA